MRVDRPGGANTVASARTVRRSGSGTFTLATEETSQDVTANTGVSSVGGIEALMALQGIEEPGERRRRALTRGRNALDALDDLKIALLAGELDGEAVLRLRAAASGLKDRSGEPGLDSVLAEIELRVEVEIAKLEQPCPAS
jgi:hypothetical protein